MLNWHEDSEEWGTDSVVCLSHDNNVNIAIQIYATDIHWLLVKYRHHPFYQNDQTSYNLNIPLKFYLYFLLDMFY